ncbi:MAG: Vacuolar protein sorting-associated protein 17 [Trizodia sp. TS-e1964]|nr:MAG: Vacuolar protein sorting-associated protein 17 [Trizodia sp. TS-e1964]
MDYSSLPDTDPAASPWGSPQNTPKQTMSGFSGSEEPRLASPYTAAAEPMPAASAETASSPSAIHQSDVSDVADGASGPYPSEPVQTRTREQYNEEHGHTSQKYLVGPASRDVKYKMQAKITGLERTGRKDPILKFDIHTNLPEFRTTQFRDVRRMHSEFVKLGDHLISSNPEALVPAVPPAISSAGAGTDEDEARVKASMQRWLNYVCGNDVLMRDDEMRFFVEGDFGYSPVVRRKQPATGVRRRVIKQFAPPPDDTPELANARPIVKLFYLGTMETGQKVDRVVKARRGLGLAESEFGVRLGQLHVQETHLGLSNAYRKLGKIIQTTGDYHAAQGTAEATTIGDPLNYHSSDAFIVKETLTNRHILLRELLQAQQATRSKLSAADRLKVSSNVKKEKVDEAISALDEARTHEDYLTQKSQRVTANLVLQRRQWFDRTSTDLRLSIREYVLRSIEMERRTLATLETIRPDIRSIDGSGGLSRLGREGLRRSSLAASQGPKGDAWSGVQRRTTLIETDPEENVEKLRGVKEVDEGEDDEDRIDARNAASRLAASTF